MSKLKCKEGNLRNEFQNIWQVINKVWLAHLEDTGVEIGMTDQILSFVLPEFSVIIENTGHFSLKQLEKRLLEMS